MIRKTLINFILIFLFLFVIRSTVYAQIPTISLPIPGKNCGIITDTKTPLSKINQCCYSTAIDLKPKDYGPPFGTVTAFINSIFGELLNPLLKLQRQITVEPCEKGGSPTTPGDLGNPNCVCILPKKESLAALLTLCKDVSSTEKTACENCLKGNGPESSVGVWTGLGCIYTNVGDFVKKTVFGLFIGLAGIISLLCIVYAAFTLQTSQGNPEKIKKAQELLTSCIMGLMLIIFSVFILRLIGVDVLKIPGFGE